MASAVSYEILTPPTVEPISVAAMKTYLRVDYSDEDSLIGQLISDARQYAEQVTRRALAPQTIRATIAPPSSPAGALSGLIGDDVDVYRLNERLTSVPFGFYGPIFALPFTPVSAIQMVEYQLTPFDGQPSATMQWTTLNATDPTSGGANYLLDTSVSPMQIAIQPMLAASRYRITYQAGYNSTSGYNTGPVPFIIVNQIRALVSYWYDNRQGQGIPDSITSQLAQKKIFQL